MQLEERDPRRGTFMLLALAGMLSACGGGNGGNGQAGSGGAAGTTGQAGSGQAGTTGQAGAAGQAGVGGQAGAAGQAGVGGQAGAAGQAGVGGQAGTGPAGAGGRGGAAGSSAGAGGGAAGRGGAAGGVAGSGGGAAGRGGAAGGVAGAGGGGGGAAGAAGSAGGAGGAAGSAGAGGAAGTGTLAGCTPGTLAPTGELLGRFGRVLTMAGGKEYFLQVNEWNSSSPQAMAYGGSTFFKMTRQEASRPTNGAPTGFPSMFIGANSRNATAGSNLPRPVAMLTTVPTTWTWNDNGTLADTTINSYNVAYDVWFSTNPAGEPTASGPTGGYLMVWLYDPPDAQPIGERLFEGVTIPNVSGTWDIWIGPNGTRPCISYVRTEPTLSMSFDLNDFIKDAVANRPNTISSAWHLTNVFIGFEIWRGGVNLETTAFCAIVN